ncbi:hypothetical protein chiPu_0008775 [Chiloscyllium punctatum]|uniref:Uncharacterized protein n=1 Tax=Chiloscyllium punctatum TaxID=137246 RepID=A0A401SIT0_CHIPU|nr:hypothetical protein [Chiloscyllium punctatum]
MSFDLRLYFQAWKSDSGEAKKLICHFVREPALCLCEESQCGIRQIWKLTDDNIELTVKSHDLLPSPQRVTDPDKSGSAKNASFYGFLNALNKVDIKKTLTWNSEHGTW